MFGAVQLGVVAACIVLFVPMGMAGWHLSRNKVLFFSGALFITLAVGVHLIPYFPSISSFISHAPSVTVLEDRTSCISLLHEITFFADSNVGSYDDSSNEVVSNLRQLWSWEDFGPVVACDFKKLVRSDASDLLNGSWVVVTGDSQARLFVVSLLSLVLGSEAMGLIREDLFKRHSDYQIFVNEIGMKLDFLWAPYVTNLTDVMTEFKRNKTYPDVLVMGAGLWDMLHFTDSSDYAFSLNSLRNSLFSLIPFSPEVGTVGPLTGYVPIQSGHLFWLGMPTLINSMLNTEEKREKMTSAVCNAYNTELLRSKLLLGHGGALLLLDIESLSQKCGASCTTDGMHYSYTVYEATVHIMLNALLIESHQNL